jgi:hypothetical protein
MAREFPKPSTGDIVHAADVVVTMGRGDACPCVRASDTRNGNSRIRKGRASKLSDRSVTRSKDASGGCSTNSSLDTT